VRSGFGSKKYYQINCEKSVQPEKMIIWEKLIENMLEKIETDTLIYDYNIHPQVQGYLGSIPRLG
jgi:hypothetical protein